MLKSKIAFILLFSLTICIGKAQNSASETYLNVRGIAELDMKPLSGATATLYEGSSEVKSVRTGSDGRFTFKLPVNKQYTIEILKDGLISKRINFNTNMPEEEKGMWTNEFSIGLVRYCEGVDYSILNEPVDIVEFDARKREFVSNEDYVARMRPRIENVLVNYERCVSDKYNDAVREADQLYKQNNYQEAISSYRAALDVFPGEEHPRKRIAELETMIAREQRNDQAYDMAVAEADALLDQQRYTEAIAKYSRAAEIKPQETYPRQKITVAEEAYSRQQAEIKEQRAKDDAYNQALVRAGTAYTQRDYETAKEYYQKAAAIKPSEALPETRLVEIQGILDKKAAEEAKAKEINDAYNNTIAEAEALMKNKEYNAAKEKYAMALTIKPAEAYPKTKMTEIDRAVEAEARVAENARKAALEKEYQSVLAEADKLFQAKDYEGAKAAYNKALTVKPSESLPRQRINAVENMVVAEQAARLKALEDEYQKVIGAANTAISQKKYNQAKELLKKALEYQPDDPHAMSKLSEVDFLIAAQQENMEILKQQEEQYNNAIAAGDQFYAGQKYNEARQEYQKALQIKSGDTYATRMLKQIEESLFTEESARKQELEIAYSSAMERGVQAFNLKNYTDAREAFQNALEIKPGDVSARKKLSDVEQAENEEENRIIAEKEKKQGYDEAVKRGDELFNEKNYTEAKTAFEGALRLIPSESYPRQRIQDINNVIAEQDKLIQEKQAIENAYQIALKSADKYYKAKEYAGARDEYNRAISFKPDESYPRMKLEEVEELIKIAEQKKTEAVNRADAYAEAINTANALYNQKEYLKAKDNYNLALEQIPGDSYASNQIDKIDRILAASSRLSSNAVINNSVTIPESPLNELIFSSNQEKDDYFEDLRLKYPEGITLEIYKEPYKETMRYIVIRNNNINEFRRIRFLTFDGEQYSVNGKPITQLYFLSQVKQREGEQYKEIVMQ